MDLLPTLLSTSWASGVNAYATVVLLGLLGKAGVGEVPDGLTENPVILGAALMYSIEFVADKIPFVDNTWDLIHTAVRPAIGSALGVEFASLDNANELSAGVGSGALSLVSHSVKGSLRLAINGSPEPVSNIITSLLEDLAVFGVMALVLDHPVIAAVIAMTLLACGIVLVVLLARFIRRAIRKWQARRGGTGPPDTGDP